MKNIRYFISFLIFLYAVPLSAQVKTSIEDSPQSVCNPSCYNINFQSGTLSGWDAYYGWADSDSASIIVNGKVGGPAGSNGCIAGASNKRSIQVTCGGSYTLILTSGGSQCIDTLNINIPFVSSPPSPAPCFMATQVCSGNPTQFDASCTAPSAGMKFYWDFYNSGNFDDSSGTNPTWTYAAPGYYPVRLHIETINGCGADTIITIFVDSSITTGVPTIIKTITNSTGCTFCNGKISLKITPLVQATISASFCSGSITVSPPNMFNNNTLSCGTGIISTTNSITLTFSNLCPGVYFFYEKLASALPPTNCYPSGFWGDTISAVINSSGVTKPVLTISNDTIYCNHAPSYQWYKNGTFITGATDSFYVAIQTGNYYVRVLDSNSCMAFSDPVTFVGIKSPIDNSLLKVYPNPAGNQLWIECPELVANNGRATITLYNILGENVYHTQLKTQNSQPKTVIDISSLARGIYVLQLNSGSKVFRTKVLKE